MGKLALTIRRQDLPISNTPGCAVYSIPGGFFNLPVTLVDRDICEKDESTLQLIPYIMLRRHDGTLFMYARGAAGEESRLHGRLSMGLGGHVDHMPDEGETLLALLQREGAREYAEEAAGVLTDALQFIGLIIDNTDSVGRVHLGLLCVVNVEADQQLALEANVIENGTWLHLSDSQFTDPAVVARLENWTQAVVTHFSTTDED